jgi:hypothetical protein
LKTYYLHLKSEDFVLSGEDWVSGVIDLYDNDAIVSMATPSYTNYSSTKSVYGLNLLGNNTWTGLNVIDDSASPSIVTESGYIKDGRFVDTSGRVDITTWTINYATLSGYDVSANISVYNSDRSDLNFPDEWYGIDNVPQHKGIYLPDVPQYAKFVLRFTSSLDTSNIDFDVLIRVNIDKPVMSPLYSRTQSSIRSFPEWMELRADGETPATPSMATPTTIAGSFINAISGEWMEDIMKDIEVLQLQTFIDTADTGQLAWAYAISTVPDIFVKVIGDNIELARAFDAIEFTEADSTDDIFYWDYYENVIYTRKLYDTLSIDDVNYDQSLSQIWNWFDEHGLVVDLPRLTGESNLSYKNRILDVYKNKPGVGLEAFKLALRRELNLWPLFGATPDSNYVGATPEVLEMGDILTDPNYIEPDGMPTDKLKKLIEYLAEKYPTTWGYFKWGEAYWDIDGENSEGYGVLPNRYDANSLDDLKTQSGVGDDLDLYVYAPNVNTGPREFNLSVNAKGRYKSTSVDRPPVNFDVDIYGQGFKSVYDNPELNIWANLELTMVNGKKYRANLQIPVKSNIDQVNATPTAESFALINLVDNGKMVPQLNWYDTSIQAEVGSLLRSVGTGTVNESGTIRWFSFHKNSIYGTSYQYIKEGNYVYLYSGDGIVHGYVSEVTNSYDGNSNYDYLILTSVTVDWTSKTIVGSADITNQSWTLPYYIYTYTDEATPTYLVDSLKLRFGSFNFSPGSAEQASLSWRNGASMYLAFDENSIFPATAPNTAGSTIVLHRSSEGERGIIVGTIVSVSNSYYYLNDATPSNDSSYDGMEIAISTMYGDVSGSDGWEIWPSTESIHDISDFPTENVTTWLSDNASFATPSNFMNATSATPWSSYLSSTLGSDPSIILSSSVTSYRSGSSWESDHNPYSVTLNGGLDNSSTLSIPIPQIVWDPYLDASPSRSIFVEFKTFNNGMYRAISSDENGNVIYIPIENITLNDSTSWFDKGVYDATPVANSPKYVISLATPTQEANFGLNETGLSVYPVTKTTWTLFEEEIVNITSGIADENGPWRNGIKPSPGKNNYNFTTLELGREDFGIPESSDYVVSWIDVSTDDDRVLSWVDQNIVHSEADSATINTETVANRILESYDSNINKYVFSPFIVRSKLKSDLNPEWNPQIHSGWFYDRNDEYYFYIDPAEEIASPGVSGATANHYYADSVARQGAPIIVNALTATPTELRQVSFFDDNISLSLTNKQSMYGNDTPNLYLAYENIYDATVYDTTSGSTVINDGQSQSHILNIGQNTNKENIYEITYKLRNSYYADHDYVDSTGSQKTKFVFNEEPSDSTPYSIVYEKANFEIATPIDIPLNTFYTVADEGFIYISYNEYNLAKVELRLNPGRIIADGKDYMLLSIYSIDENGNPKPNQQFTLHTTFGTFDESSSSTVNISTDNDGFASSVLASVNGSSTSIGTLTISGGVSATVDFEIEIKKTKQHSLLAMVTPDSIPADGYSSTSVFGRVIDQSGNPVPYAYVAYRKARSMFDVFNNDDATPDVGPSASPASTPSWPDFGRVKSDESGTFRIGPFTASTPTDAGYWFLMAESFGASPTISGDTWETVGDVVFWQEHPPMQNAVNEENLMPPVSTNIREIPFIWTDSDGVVHYDHIFPPSATVNAYPVTNDEATPQAGVTPVTITWSPPKWYAIRAYDQYQRGLLGNDYYVFDIGSTESIHPTYRDK